jgi:hypothetical protein
MRTAAVENEQVVWILGFPQDKSPVAGGGPLPAVDLDNRKGEGGWRANLHILQFSYWDPALACILAQGRVDQIGDRGETDRSGNDAADDYGRPFNEIPPVDFRHKHLQYNVTASSVGSSNPRFSIPGHWQAVSLSGNCIPLADLLDWSLRAHARRLLIDETSGKIGLLCQFLSLWIIKVKPLFFRGNLKQITHEYCHF